MVSPKKRCDLLIDCKVEFLNPTDVAEAVENIETDLILQTSLPKPKIDYQKEMITKSVPKPDDVFFISSNIKQILDNLQQIMTPENVMKIE